MSLIRTSRSRNPGVTGPMRIAPIRMIGPRGSERSTPAPTDAPSRPISRRNASGKGWAWTSTTGERRPPLRARARSGEDGNRVHLDEEAGRGEPAHLDGRAGGRLGAEVLRAHVDVLEELVDVGDIGVGLDEVADLRARR